MSDWPGGYSADPATLNTIKSQLHSASHALDEVTKPPPAIDAGASSGAVGETLSRVIQLGAALANNFDETASKVDAVSGAYGDMENNNKANLDKLNPDFGQNDPTAAFSDVDGYETMDPRRKHEGF